MDTPAHCTPGHCAPDAFFGDLLKSLSPLPVSEAAGEGVRPQVDGEGIPPVDPPLPPNNKPYLARALKRCSVYAGPDRCSRVIGHLRPNEIVQVIPYTGHWVRCGPGYILSVDKKHVNLIKVG